QPVKSLRTVSPRSSVTAVHAAQRYHHFWNPGVGDGLAHRCSILSPCSRPGANRGIPEDGGRWLILSPTFAEAQFAFFAHNLSQLGFNRILGLTQNDIASFVGWSPQPSAVGPVPHQPGFLIVLRP